MRIVVVFAGVVLAGLALPLAAHDGPAPCREGETCYLWADRFSYPNEAIRRREEGSVQIEFTVDVAGHVRDCSVVRPSGSPSLDRATCDQFERYAHFIPASDEQGRAVQSRIRQTFSWVLPGN